MSGTRRAPFLSRWAFAIFVLFVCLFSPVFVRAGTHLEALNFSLPKNTIQRPTAAAQAPDGKTYVCDAAKQYVAVFDADNTPLFTFNKNLSLPIDIVLSDTRVFVLDETAGVIFVYNDSGKYLSTIGAAGISAGQFSHPSALTTDGATLFVADTGNNRIQLFDIETLELTAIFGAEQTGIAVTSPSALAVSGDALYVVESGGAMINAYDKTTGAPLGISLVKSAERSIDIAVVDSGLALSSPVDKKIYYYDLNLTLQRSIGTPKKVYQLAAAPSGHLLACGSTSRTDDGLLYDFAGDDTVSVIPGSSAGLKSPSAMAKDASGNFYVADTGNHRVLKFNSSLTLTDTISDIPDPLDLAWYDDHLYVLDASAPAFLIYDQSGGLTRTIPLNFTANPRRFELVSESEALVCGSSDLYLVDFSGDEPSVQTLSRDLISNPQDVAVSGDDVFVLNDTDGELLYLSLTGGSAYIIPLSAMGPVPSDASGIAISSAGDITISDAANSLLYCYGSNFEFDQKIATDDDGFSTPTALYASGETLYVCFSASDTFAKLVNPVASGNYYITLDDEKLDGFDETVTIYSARMSASDDYVDIDCVAGDGFTVSGDIGRYLLFYGLNTFDISVDDGKTEIDYTVYITRNYPEGFTAEGLDDYIAYIKEKNSGAKETENQRKSAVILDIENLDMSGLRITSFSKDAIATLEGNQVRIELKDSAGEDPPIIQIATSDGLVLLSADALNRLIIQKRNQYILYTAFAGVVILLLVYFFMDYLKKHPGKRHYRRKKK